MSSKHYYMTKKAVTFSDIHCTTKHMLACATDMTINKESGGLPPVNPAAVIFALDQKQLTTLMKSGSVL